MEAKTVDKMSWIGNKKHSFIYTIMKRGEDDESREPQSIKYRCVSQRRTPLVNMTIQDAKCMYDMNERRKSDSSYHLSCLEIHNHNNFIMNVIRGHGLKSKSNKNKKEAFYEMHESYQTINESREK